MLTDSFKQRLNLLSCADVQVLLQDLQRGIEREALRVDTANHLAQTPHPAVLGSPLTHPSITTDFSEALLEFVTPVTTGVDNVLAELDRIHRFVYSQLQDEMLWSASMPCLLGDESTISIAQYGSSPNAQMKTIYRRGLSHRYGRAMQTIAGIHYNFSLPDGLWQLLQADEGDTRARQDYITERYFDLIRNVNRYSWLLIYCYGASPVVDKDFFRIKNTVQPQDWVHCDANSLTHPYATALRLSDVGYQSTVQASIDVNYNSLDAYSRSLCQAIQQPYPPYAKIGVQQAGVYQQLSTSLLQIENECYSLIRPKRVAPSGKIPLGVLQQQGVEYIEMRCIDNNPALPLGIDADQIRFLDCFLLYCLLQPSPPCDQAEQACYRDNLARTVQQGRDPSLRLMSPKGPIPLAQWGEHLLDGISAIAQQLDQAHNTRAYQTVCQKQRDKLRNPALTPSARCMDAMQGQSLSFIDWAAQWSRQHQADFLARPLPATEQQAFVQQVCVSIAQQQQLEARDKRTTEAYLRDYYQQYQALRID